MLITAWIYITIHKIVVTVTLHSTYKTEIYYNKLIILQNLGLRQGGFDSKKGCALFECNFFRLDSQTLSNRHLLYMDHTALTL